MIINFYLLLDLKQGEKIGYEVKDDFHIEKPDGTIVLMQAKHTIQKNSTGEAINTTTLDGDMWKTLDIWTKYIDSISESDVSKYFTISQHAFKKQQRSYKRIIRLDKKIQIIIDGNRDHIEQGEDEKGKYYKVYYTSEE